HATRDRRGEWAMRGELAVAAGHPEAIVLGEAGDAIEGEPGPEIHEAGVEEVGLDVLRELGDQGEPGDELAIAYGAAVPKDPEARPEAEALRLGRRERLRSFAEFDGYHAAGGIMAGAGLAHGVDDGRLAVGDARDLEVIGAVLAVDLHAHDARAIVVDEERRDEREVFEGEARLTRELPYRLRGELEVTCAGEDGAALRGAVVVEHPMHLGR